MTAVQSEPGGQDGQQRSAASEAQAQEMVSHGNVLAGDGNQGGGWDLLWRAGKTPWDAGESQPALQELFDRKGDLPRGRALVPGCGTGYDVAFLASQGYQSIGLESSEKASTMARARFGSVPGTAFVQGDFFTYNPGGLVLAFDYTFFCALPPKTRDRIAARYGELLPPNGYLMTLIYPIDGDREGGPPYSVSLEIYERHFLPLFVHVMDFRPSRAAGKWAGKPMQVERQHMVLWQRR